ncbi:MAG TPA: hypothetical protein VGF10_08180 [Gaiella sp.]
MSRTGPTTYRDPELGTALRELDVPDHSAAFFADLERQLAAEPARRPTRRLRLRWGFRIAAVAASVGVVAAVVGWPRAERTQLASAAVVKERVRASLDTLRTLSGVIVTSGPRADDERRFRFALDAKGDFRLDGPAPGEVITYDAAAGVARSAQHSASMGGDAIFYAERRGIAPGPPEQGPPSWILPDALGAYVRALLASGDPRVEEVVYEGRPAWRVEVDTVPNAMVPALSGDRLEITVDRQSGIPVRVVESRAGAMLHELRIEQLKVDEPVEANAFTFSFPPGSEVIRSDEGFRRVSLAAVTGTVGYTPLVPSAVPDGYELAEVAVATDAGPTGTEAGNPPSRKVVSLAYRRGLDRFVVTTRLAGSAAWSDPLASGEGYVDHPEHVTLETGVLRDAQVVLSPHGVPHLWAVANGLVVTIAGDLSRAELVTLARSLRTAG